MRRLVVRGVMGGVVWVGGGGRCCRAWGPVMGSLVAVAGGWIFVVPLDLWDHLGRRVTPMLAVYATATVVVTVAAGTRCAWYGLTGPLDAEQSPPGPGT